jgi:hypothetical protein
VIGGARIAIALVAIAVVGGALTGCSRGIAGAQAPAAGVSATTTTPTAPPAAGAPVSVQGIQSDLNSADSATANAGGDVADADSAAATSDSP